MNNLNEIIKDIADTQDCTRCKGTGISKGYVSANVTISDKPCIWCKGLGKFERPDLDLIFNALQGRKGIRTAKPKNNGRAAYVWRMYRFDSGIDVTLPMMALLDVTGDPYEKLLTEFASVLAKTFKGTNMAGASRWAPLLGIKS